jgi:hypothetical protein
MMRKFQSGFTGLFLFIAFVHSQYAQSQCTDLFISEYVEGNFFNKAIELYNPTPNAIDLSNYRLIRWDNGSVDSDQPGSDNILNLANTVNPYSAFVLVIGTSQQGQELPADPALAAKADAFYSTSCIPGTGVVRTLCFNGDDALSLQKANGNSWINIDIFACIGERPSNSSGTFSPTAAWTDIAPFSSMPIGYDGSIPYFTRYWTANQTLKRKSSVQSGVTINPEPETFNASIEWDTIGLNMFDSLGFHQCNCEEQASSTGIVQSNGFSALNDPNIITFAVQPVGCSSFNFQWYSFNGITLAPSGSSIAGWTLIPGATSNSYNPPTLSQSTTFACFVTPSDGCGTPGWAQGAASFTITASAGQVNSASAQQCSLAPVELSFTSTPSGLGNVAYQWYYQNGTVACPQGSSTFGWQIVNGANTATASFTPPSAGTYTLACFINSETGVGLWASGCKLLVSTSFTAQEIIGNPTVTPFTPTAYLVSQIAGHTYQWSVTGGAIANGQGTNFVNVVWNNTGPYSIQLIESDGVCSDVSVLDLGVITGVNNHDDSGLTIFPNPASDIITIRGLGENANGKYTLYDLSGRALQTGVVSGDGCSVPVGNLKAGNYAIHVITSKSSSVSLIHVSRNQ